MKRYEHFTDIVAANILFKERRFVYIVGGGEAQQPKSTETGKAAPEKPATPTDTQDAKKEFNSQKTKLEQQILVAENDKNPKIVAAAKKAYEEMKKLSPPDNLNDQEKGETLIKIRETLSEQLAAGFEKKREPVKAELEKQMKIRMEEPKRYIKFFLGRTQYMHLRPEAKQALEAKASEWITAYETKINDAYFSVRVSHEEMQKNIFNNPDYFANLNQNLDNASRELKGKYPLAVEIYKIDSRFWVEIQNTALDDLALRPEELARYIDKEVVFRQGALKIDAKKGSKKDKADLPGKIAQADAYGLEAKNQLANLTGAQDRPKRAVILAHFHDQISSLWLVPENGDPATMDMAKRHGMGGSKEGREWVHATTGVNLPEEKPTEKKPSEEKPAEKPAAKLAERKPPQHYDSAAESIKKNVDSADGATFLIKLNRGMHPVRILKKSAGYELNFGEEEAAKAYGSIKLDATEASDAGKVVEMLKSGKLEELATIRVLSSGLLIAQDQPVKNWPEIGRLVVAPRLDSNPAQFTLDWGNGLIANVSATVGTAGVISFNVTAQGGGASRDNVRTGYADSIGDLKRQIKHIRWWDENPDRSPANLNFESSWKDIADPKIFYDNFQRIGQKTEFRVLLDGGAKVQLDWGGGNMPDAKGNPEIRMRVMPNGDIAYTLKCEGKTPLNRGGTVKNIQELIKEIEFDRKFVQPELAATQPQQSEGEVPPTVVVGEKPQMRKESEIAPELKPHVEGVRDATSFPFLLLALRKANESGKFSDPAVEKAIADKLKGNPDWRTSMVLPLNLQDRNGQAINWNWDVFVQKLSQGAVSPDTMKAFAETNTVKEKNAEARKEQAAKWKNESREERESGVVAKNAVASAVRSVMALGDPARIEDAVQRSLSTVPKLQYDKIQGQALKVDGITVVVSGPSRMARVDSVTEDYYKQHAERLASTFEPSGKRKSSEPQSKAA